jgi:putative redox protein
MTRQTFRVPLSPHRTLEGELELPPGAPIAGALFAHCLTANAPALAAIRTQLADQGCAVLTIDCGVAAADQVLTALTTVELAAALDAFTEQFPGPVVLIGHSWGGVLALACAGRSRVQAIVTINAPAGMAAYTRRARKAANSISLGATSINLPEPTPDLDWEALQAKVEVLRRPLLILHAPLDQVADISSAAQIFTAAKHPKSFVSLDSADHLLARPGEAQHVAAVVCGWARRYLRGPDASEPDHTGVTVAEAGNGRYRQRIRAGVHRGIADEPVSAGGDNAGPSPYELLLSALGACTAMTLRMYAELKKLPLRHVSVDLRHEKVHAQACQECETKEGKIDRIERVITLEGELSDEQRAKLLEIANKCPVHRTLHAEVWIPTRLAPPA